MAKPKGTRMVYHAETKEHLKIFVDDQVPEGYVSFDVAFRGGEPEAETPKVDLEKEQKKDDKAAKALFKKLKMTREEGEEILKEDGVDFNDDDDDLTIAMAVKELLEDDSE